MPRQAEGVIAPGVLYVVGTPIGNLEDVTLRALRVLKEADVIAAEDTRHTQHLLARYDITTPLTSYHDFNEAEKARMLVERLRAGQAVALVSDAGTPCISDPGYALITCCIEAGIRVIPVPGPTAGITALSVSGLPTEAFVFEGFLPRKAAARCRRLEALKTERRTVIVHEAPHRLARVLADLLAIVGDRRIVAARELTKLHEEIFRGRVSTLLAAVQARGSARGEYTLVIEGDREAGKG